MSTRAYEHTSTRMTDHLGNVRVVLSDKKSGTPTAPLQVNYFDAGISTWQATNVDNVLTNENGKLKVSYSGVSSSNTGAYVQRTVQATKSYTWKVYVDIGNTPSIYLYAKQGATSYGIRQINESGEYTINFTANSSGVVDLKVEAISSSNYQFYIDNSIFTEEGVLRPEILSTTGYYPFGMPMPGRTYNNAEYRFGFNGKENDNEVKGTGNQINYDARMLDTRLGRFLSIDPATQKYPFSSPFVAFGNSPIYFKDNGGKTLEPGGNKALALNDIRSLVPKEFHSQIQINSSGKIEFQNYDKLPDAIKSYEGVSLVNNLINSTKDYKYTAGRQVEGIKRTTNERFMLTEPKGNTSPEMAISNLSITPRSDYPLDDMANFLPEKGYDGSIRIGEGEFFRKNPTTGTGRFSYDRSKVIFHEFLENYLRTENGKDYPGNNGAHQGASDKANKFSKEITGKGDSYGGYATDYVLPDLKKQD